MIPPVVRHTPAGIDVPTGQACLAIPTAAHEVRTRQFTGTGRIGNELAEPAGAVGQGIGAVTACAGVGKVLGLGEAIATEGGLAGIGESVPPTDGRSGVAGVGARREPLVVADLSVIFVVVGLNLRIFPVWGCGERGPGTHDWSF